MDQIHRAYPGAGQQIHITERRPGDAVPAVYAELVNVAAR
jgi:hypothetical protein